MIRYFATSCSMAAEVTLFDTAAPVWLIVVSGVVLAVGTVECWFHLQPLVERIIGLDLNETPTSGEAAMVEPILESRCG